MNLTLLFFPGGGQPSDAGTLVVEGAPDVHYKVLHCIRKGLQAIHYVWFPTEAASSSAVTPGTSVTLFTNWARRLDHSSLHTSQHLLSALLDRINLPTISWSLPPYPSKAAPYIEISRPLTKEERVEAETMANSLIGDGQSVSVQVSKQGQDQEEELVAAVEDGLSLERSNAATKSLPKDYSDGYLRDITIDQVDKGPCCGTHLPSLSFLNALHILPTTISHNKSTVRQYFLVSSTALHLFNFSL